MITSTTTINVPVFAGQGTTAMASLPIREQATRDASHPSGALLLSACHTAFRRELSTLSAEEADRLGIPAFSAPTDLLSIIDEPTVNNPLLSTLSLLLVQSLRYLAHVEENCVVSDSLTPFSDHLCSNSEHEIGVVGFSSGILPACAVASSEDSLSFIRHTRELFRYAFWLGLRSHQYQSNVAREAGQPTRARQSWSRVVLGEEVSQVKSYIESYNTKTHGEPQLYLTAIVNDTNVTVSGRPDLLEHFANTLPSQYRVVPLPIDTLYHSPVHCDGIRKNLLADVESRGIRFPTIEDLRVPLCSTFTGEIVSGSDDTLSLVEVVTDMILTQPVNWDRVTKRLSRAFPKDIPIAFINFGPGTGLTRIMAKALPKAAYTDHTLDNGAPPPDPENRETRGQIPIAIVGMAVNMPGAPTVDKLWEVLEKGINTVSEVPTERFNISEYTHPSDHASKRAMRSHTGNFIADPSLFDAKFFRISPREAKSMDPQQRILLHAAYEALENAGYVPDATPSFQKDTFGCYIGVATDDYVQNLRHEIDVYYSTGTLRAFLSGRISYAMDWSGPSIVVDTACSSSLVSIYQACRALSNRDCNAAIAGGVNIITSPDMMIGLDRAHFLSPTGQCKSFDSSADGYSRSEGCGLFVLKRLSDALAENDNILGVIRGIEVNQSGNAHSITHPHSPTQAKLLKRLLERAGVDKHRVNLVEAHGTGTQAGDPSELDSIRRTFSISRPKSNPLHITSVKANIGHLEAASGAASLAKLLLMLRHRTIPRLISLEKLNPVVPPLNEDNTIIDTSASPWLPSEPGATRMSMLNNFGAAGSNVALLLEEHIAPSRISGPSIILPFCFSAKDSGALKELRQRYIDFLRAPARENQSIFDLAYTATARRQIYSCRMAVSASTRQELIDKLEQASLVDTSTPDANVAFVFSGQGGQYLGMGAQLYRTSPNFRTHIEKCRSLLLSMGYGDILTIILSHRPPSDMDCGDEVEVYQTAVFSLEYSLARLWMSWGVTPKAVIGHSLGEYAALVVAGVMDLRGALLVVASRARLMVQRCLLETTGMIAVNGDSSSIAMVLASSSSFDRLNIACYNSSSDCVVAGPRDQLRAFKCHLDDNVRCKNTILNVPYGYHSPAMNPLTTELNAVLETIQLNPPTIPVASNVYGIVVQPGDTTTFTPSYFSRHCVEPVRFSAAFDMLLADVQLAPSVWIEIGPQPTTLPMMKASPSLPRNARLLPSLRKDRDSWSVLSSSLCSLYLEKSDLMWRNVYEHIGPVACVTLPSYPFSPTKFWVDYKESATIIAPSVESSTPVHISKPKFAIAGTWVQRPSPENHNVAAFEVPIAALSELISGHIVGEHALCPASVYHELAVVAIRLATEQRKEERHISLRDTEFSKPLVCAQQDPRNIRTSISLDDRTFAISSLGPNSLKEHVHCSGKFTWDSIAKTTQNFLQLTPILHRDIASIAANENAEFFSTRTAYEIIFPRVVHYAKNYHSMRSLAVHPSGMEGHAIVRIPHSLSPGNYVVHPVFVDTLLHVAGFVANLQASPTDGFICSKVDSVKVIPELVDNDATYSVFCRNTWLPEKGLILADAYAVTSGTSPTMVAHVKRMHFRRVRLTSLTQALSLAEGDGRSSHISSSPTISRSAPVVHKSNAPGVLDLVQAVVAETCNLPLSSIDVRADLASFGVDSLMAIEIVNELQVLFPAAELQVGLLPSRHTIMDIVAQMRSRDPSTSSRPSTPQSAGSNATDETINVEENDQIASIKNAIAHVLEIGSESIHEDTDLETFGLDSLTSIELTRVLQDTLSIPIPGDLLSSHRTIRAISDFVVCGRQITKVVGHQKTTSVSSLATPLHSSSAMKALNLSQIPVSLLESDGDTSPLYLIHDGSGLVNHYSRISNIGRKLRGISNPNFFSTTPWDDLSSMATHYASLISRTSTTPVILGGWSFGGVVAHEVARQMIAAGQRVKGVVLIDSPSPVNHVPLSNALINAVLDLEKGASKTDVARLVKNQFQMSSRMLGDYEPPTTGPHPAIVLLRSSEGLKLDHTDGPVVEIPEWLSDRSDPSRISVGWERLTQSPVKVIDIPGNHFEVFDVHNIDAVSRKIAEACDYLDSNE
ncbi:polyketide beta-ketoacyl-synthase [Marasmius tenuissimus]|uniref:Polyketide beta-ketoacyl-synthase n=1 Tax=Marasmius tenuissimus TaxID=585030 RepID=A0ABR3A5E9_9AGAR